MCNNSGVSKETLKKVFFLSENNDNNNWIRTTFIEKLIKIITSSCQSDSKIRICTLELCLKLLLQLSIVSNSTVLSDAHLAAIFGKYPFFFFSLIKMATCYIALIKFKYKKHIIFRG